MNDLLNTIVETINDKYNGKLDCEQQRADLFVYVNGNEESIKAVDSEVIYFHDENLNVKLIDADIHHLAYLNAVI
tara:strand:+ start:695 stop:919 length:225 start_codon:yes stop_codon:yes gene_type:complete